MALHFTLRQLAYFISAHDHGSVAGAAEALNVSQPSVSAALAKLEDQLGVQLLVRHHARGVSLTPAGKRLLGDARSLLRHAEEWQRHARMAGGALAGELRLGSFSTLAPAYLPGLVSAFAAHHPGVDINVAEGAQDELLAGLRSARFDLALLYDVDLPDDIEARLLCEAPPYAILPCHHRLARERRVHLAQLAAEPLVLLDVPPSRAYFLGLFAAAGLKPRVTFSSPSLEMVRGLVGRGLGVSVLITRPHGDVTYEGQPIAVAPLADAVEPGRIAIARLAGLRSTRLMEAFMSWCQDHFDAAGNNR